VRESRALLNSSCSGSVALLLSGSDGSDRVTHFSIEDLAQHAGVSLRILESLAERIPAGRAHTVCTHRKRRGGIREIVKPGPMLDIVTKNLHRSFSTVLPYRPADHVHGFISGRSTVSNAAAHLNKACVLRVDLEDFFPSIRSAGLEDALQGQGYDEKAAELVVGVVTIGGKLPIGLSTSPILSNLAFEGTDKLLASYAEAKGLSFTRYVDDLTFSGEVDDRTYSDIEQIICQSGWSISEHKTAFMRRGGPQYVTGLYVGDASRPRIPRRLKREMRRILHIIQTMGYDTYMTEFGGEEAEMWPRRLRGLACYIAGVEPDLGFPLLRDLDEELPSAYIPPNVDLGDLRIITNPRDLA
jgi:RNA-directed DNA polymerase